jgi:hypothetical protein
MFLYDRKGGMYMNKNFKLTFQLVSGYFAAKILWKLVDDAVSNIDEFVTRFIFKKIRDAAGNGNNEAKMVCDVYNIRYESTKFKTKEPIGFRKE